MPTELQKVSVLVEYGEREGLANIGSFSQQAVGEVVTIDEL